MPELPEVETIKRHLGNNILHKKISKIEIIDKRIIDGASAKFTKELEGKTFSSLERFGKALVFDVDKDLFLFIHLRMTGQLVYKRGTKEIYGGHPIENIHSGRNKFTCIVFSFEDGSNLFFNSIRKFSRAKLMDQKARDIFAKRFGSDPTSEKFTFKRFLEIIENKKTNLKSFLLNQEQIAGIGNIYADEICFFAGVLPNRSLISLNLDEKKKIYNGIKQILKKAIEKGGTTFRDYRNAEGGAGGFSPYLKIYGKKVGEKCARGACNGKIAKKKVAGRTTGYCQGCQK